MKKILVLGGNGFLGFNLTQALLREGYAIRVFDKYSDNFDELHSKNLEIFNGDFSDIFALTEALEGVDIVFHLVSTSIPSTSNLDPARDVETNLIATIKLLQVMVQKKIDQLVYFSSGGTVYGNPTQFPVTEDEQLNPICSYGVIKASIEKYLYMYKVLHGLQYTVIRPSNPYGPFQTHTGFQGVIGTILTKLLNGEVFSIWGDGSIERDFIYVDDLVLFCSSLIKKSLSGIYNIGSGKSYSINELIETIQSVTGLPVKREYLPTREFDVLKLVLDIKKANQEHGWKPATSLEDGIKKTWIWYKKRNESLPN